MNAPPGPVLPGSPVYGDYSHRLQAVGTSPRTYDAVGNTLTGQPALSAQNAQAEYDARNRLTGLKVGTNSYLARYQYNGRGERVVRHVGGVGHLFAYDESGQLLGRYATDTAPGSSWTLDEEIVWLENTPIASVRIESGQPVVRAILSDHLNSPRALSALHGGSQPAGTLVWKWSLTSRTPAGNNAYGNEAPDEDPDGNGAAVKFDLRFPGQQAEAESGRYYNYFRDYEPATGRYLESDPIGLGGGLSTFAYVRGRPLSAVDLRGLFTVEPGCSCSSNPTHTWVSQVEYACQNLNAIKNPSLRSCLQIRCDTATIKCRNDGACSNNGVNGRAAVPSLAFPGAYPAWNPPEPDMYMCPNNFYGVGVDRDVGSMVIHEWAHTCGWSHFNGPGLDGVPETFCVPSTDPRTFGPVCTNPYRNSFIPPR